MRTTGRTIAFSVSLNFIDSLSAQDYSRSFRACVPFASVAVEVCNGHYNGADNGKALWIGQQGGGNPAPFFA